MPTLRESVAQNLGRVLREKGMSQSDLARGMEISIKTVNTLVKAKVGVSSDMISRIANYLHIEETDLTSAPESSSEIAREAARAAIAEVRSWPAPTTAPLPPDLAEMISKLDDRGLKRLRRFLTLQLKSDGMTIHDKAKKKR